MHKKQKGFSSILVVLLVVIILLVLGYVYYSNNKINQSNGEKQQITQDKNRIVSVDDLLMSEVPQCKTKNTVEEKVFSENLLARIEKCNDGVNDYSIVSTVRNNKEQILRVREIKGSETESPFYGFKDINFLNENYLVYSYSYWEISHTLVYDLQAQKDVLSFVGSIKKTGDGKYFFIYGGGMGSEPQLKLYSLSSLSLVKDFSASEEVPSFRTCSQENNTIKCEREYDGKELVYNINN